MLSDSNKKFDIVIVGGGVSGAFAAICLSRRGWRVAVIEKTDLLRPKAGESLAPKCRQHFRRIEFRVPEKASIDYLGIHSVWADGLSEHDFTYNPYGNGLAVERSQFEIGLARYAASIGCVVFLNTSIESMTRESGGWRIKTSTHEKKRFLNARLLILATGRSSCKLFKPARRIYFDKLLALSAVVDTDDGSSNPVMRIESMPQGWFYTTRIPNQRRIITFFTDHDLTSKSISRASFLSKMIRQTVWFRETGFEKTLTHQEIQLFDARTFFSSMQSGDGWLAIGDAAYSIDPLSGQGIQKNLEMIEFLEEPIKRFFEAGVGFESFVNFNRRNFAAFMKQRASVYATETKWRKSVFWKRRK